MATDTSAVNQRQARAGDQAGALVYHSDQIYSMTTALNPIAPTSSSSDNTTKIVLQYEDNHVLLINPKIQVKKNQMILCYDFA